MYSRSIGNIKLKLKCYRISVCPAPFRNPNEVNRGLLRAFSERRVHGKVHASRHPQTHGSETSGEYLSQLKRDRTMLNLTVIHNQVA